MKVFWKEKIYKIIPERSFLVKFIKKIYGFFLWLKSKLTFPYRQSLLRKWKKEFISSHPNVIEIDEMGGELFALSRQKGRLSKDSPIVVYKSSRELTRKFNYHPVEILWLLSELGYLFFVLDEKTGKIRPRQDREYEGEFIASKIFLS